MLLFHGISCTTVARLGLLRTFHQAARFGTSRTAVSQVVWMSEDYRMSILDAVAFDLTYYEFERPSTPNLDR